VIRLSTGSRFSRSSTTVRDASERCPRCVGIRIDHRDQQPGEQCSPAPPQCIACNPESAGTAAPILPATPRHPSSTARRLSVARRPRTGGGAHLISSRKPARSTRCLGCGLLRGQLLRFDVPARLRRAPLSTRSRRRWRVGASASKDAWAGFSARLASHLNRAGSQLVLRAWEMRCKLSARWCAKGGGLTVRQLPYRIMTDGRSTPVREAPIDRIMA
jgi:hypothetical protein